MTVPTQCPVETQCPPLVSKCQAVDTRCPPVESKCPVLETRCPVVDIGIVPTPAFYFARRRLATKGGVMVTASHNPPDHNGKKIVLGDLPIAEEEMGRVKAIAESGRFASGHGGLSARDPRPEYGDFIMGAADEAMGGITPPRVGHRSTARLPRESGVAARTGTHRASSSVQAEKPAG